MRWAVFAACFCFTIEIACRIEQRIVYGAPILGVYTYESALFTADEYGIVGKPNGHYEKWQLNSFGFRGPEVSLEKKAGRLRIVCVGASETFGLYETAGKEWPRQLERMLAREGVDAEVINGAVAGMSLSQRARQLRRRLLRFKPDVVLFMLEYGSHAGLTAEKVRVLRENPGVLPEHKGVIEKLKLLRSTSRVKDIVLPKLPAPIQEIIGIMEGVFKLEVRKRELGSQYRSYAHVQLFEVQTFLDQLEDLSAMATNAGARLVLLSPAMWFTERNFSNIYLSWPYVDKSWWQEAKVALPPAARAFAIQHGIDFIDLSDVVKGQEDIWMKDMLHFSDEGAEHVADRVADQVVRADKLTTP